MHGAVAVFDDDPDARVRGAYLQGSLATGCFHRAKSDLDLLIVVDDPLPATARARTARRLAEASLTRPILGDVELSVLTAANARTFVHPSPFELHYSETWRAAILADEVDYTEERTDEDLAVHVTMTRARGLSLAGPPPHELLGPATPAAYVDSVIGDIEWLLSDDNLLGSPYYGVLNICRTLRGIGLGVEEAMREGTSKEEGGLWALETLPAVHRRLVEQALACYRSARPVPESERRTDGHGWDTEALRAFADHARQATDTWLRRS